MRSLYVQSRKRSTHMRASVCSHIMKEGEKGVETEHQSCMILLWDIVIDPAYKNNITYPG